MYPRLLCPAYTLTLLCYHNPTFLVRLYLYRNLLKAFPEASEDDISAFLPNKDGDLSLGKVQVCRPSP